MTTEVLEYYVKENKDLLDDLKDLARAFRNYREASNLTSQFIEEAIIISIFARNNITL